MSSDQPYTPSDEAVRGNYARSIITHDNPAYIEKGADPLTAEEINAEFDRFLARVRRDAAREALDGLAEHEMELHSRDPKVYAECKHVAVSARSWRETHYRIPEETP